MAKAKRKKNLTEEDKAKLARYEKKYHAKAAMLENGLIIATEVTEDQQMVAKGWADCADDITDEMRKEYREALKEEPSEETLKLASQRLKAHHHKK